MYQNGRLFLIPNFCFAYVYNCEIEKEFFNEVYIFQIDEKPGKLIFKGDKTFKELFKSDNYLGQVIQTKPFKKEYELVVTRFHKKGSGQFFEGIFYRLDYYGEPMANYVRITPWKENMPISIWDTLLGEFKEGKCS